jgi:hypothetical protein
LHGSFLPSGHACRCYVWTSEQEFPFGRWKHKGEADYRNALLLSDSFFSPHEMDCSRR